MRPCAEDTELLSVDEEEEHDERVVTVEEGEGREAPSDSPSSLGCEEEGEEEEEELRAESLKETTSGGEGDQEDEASEEGERRTGRGARKAGEQGAGEAGKRANASSPSTARQLGEPNIAAIPRNLLPWAGDRSTPLPPLLTLKKSLHPFLYPSFTILPSCESLQTVPSSPPRMPTPFLHLPPFHCHKLLRTPFLPAPVHYLQSLALLHFCPVCPAHPLLHICPVCLRLSAFPCVTNRRLLSLPPSRPSYCSHPHWIPLPALVPLFMGPPKCIQLCTRLCCASSCLLSSISLLPTSHH